MEEKLMPDFDTRTSQESKERNRPRMTSIANRLSSLLSASKLRILSMASSVRLSLMANKLRSLLIGGVLSCVIALASFWLLIYSSSHQEGGSSTEDLSAAANGNSAPNQAEEGGEVNRAIPVGPQQLKSTTPVGPAQQLVFGIRDVGLYAMDPAGSDPTRLTDGDSPAWSPDGKRIAYTKYLKEPNPEATSSSSSATPEPFTETPSIFVMNANGSGGMQLVDKAAVQPVWSPNGEQIAFTIYAPGKRYKGAGYTYCGIYVMDADGSGTPRKLATGPGCAFSPAWSPDGKKIAYTNGEGLDESGGSDTTDVYVVNAPGEEGGTGQPRALTDSAPGTAGGPSWSPEGTEIAFTYAGQYVNGKGGIYKMNADGSGKTPIALSQRIKTKEGQWDFKTTPVWSPDGDQISYVRGVPHCDPYCGGSIYFQQIYIMDSSGLNPTLIRDFGTGRDVTGLDWRPSP
jgi:Tol biopolymer transport system component